jgi:hypothetical protein
LTEAYALVSVNLIGLLNAHSTRRATLTRIIPCIQHY